jgi:hypothetical protein
MCGNVSFQSALDDLEEVSTYLIGFTKVSSSKNSYWILTG